MNFAAPLQIQDCSLLLRGANVMTRGVDLNEFIGQEFEVQNVRLFRN